MGTRGRIAICYKGQIVFCIWVNSDAYPSHIGKIILEKLHRWEKLVPLYVKLHTQFEPCTEDIKHITVELSDNEMARTPYADLYAITHSSPYDVSIQTLATSIYDEIENSATYEEEYMKKCIQMDALMQKTMQDIWCEHLYIIHVDPQTSTEIIYTNTSTYDGYTAKCNMIQFEYIVECDGNCEDIPDDKKANLELLDNIKSSKSLLSKRKRDEEDSETATSKSIYELK